MRHEIEEKYYITVPASRAMKPLVEIESLYRTQTTGNHLHNSDGTSHWPQAAIGSLEPVSESERPSPKARALPTPHHDAQATVTTCIVPSFMLSTER